MLRAAFALVALSAAAARHDGPRHGHDHDERHDVGQIPNCERDLINMQFGTRIGTDLITCNKMQTGQCEAPRGRQARTEPTNGPRDHDFSAVECSDRRAGQLAPSSKQQMLHCNMLVDGAPRAQRIFDRNKDVLLGTTHPRGDTMLARSHDRNSSQRDIGPAPPKPGQHDQLLVPRAPRVR